MITRAGINSVSLRDSSVYKYLNDSANVPKFRNDLLLPLAGSRICDAAASVSYQGYNGNYWSSSPSGTYARKLDLTTSDVGAYDYNPRANGFSLRCFKNS
ncbi:MAG: fibrobacter succinogenes major paralogous domain-containing protein [Candidatus Peribacteria bacterium]|nr:fibrobacter succinogenes major paralogous domain-containing protein [Candidatus Peribacteria bacterium]